MLLTELKPRPTRMPKTAMILAAGRGTRLAPYTETLPKPLIEVGGRCILDHTLDRLVEAGVGTAVINVSHLGHLIEERLAGRRDIEIRFSREDTPLETGGGVRKALPLLGGEPFFAINGDSLWVDALKPTLGRLAEAWRPEEMDVLLLMHPFSRVPGWHGVGDYFMDPLGRLTRREERRVAPYAYMGVSILKPEIFRDAPDGAFSLNRLYDRAEEAGRLFGAIHDGLWYHISTPDDLATARRRFAAGHAPDVIYF